MDDVVKATLKWREITEEKEHMETKLLELFKHPDAEPDHLKAAHKAYVEVCHMYAQAKEALMLKYPNNHVDTFPWNKRG